MSKTPRQRAEACFAVARSTAHTGERENAIGRGKLICERNGLDLDDFDIPGRARKVRHGGMAGGAFDLDLEAFHARQSAYSSTQDDLFSATKRAYEASELFRRTQESARADRPHYTTSLRRCPGCGVSILYGDSCTDCDRRAQERAFWENHCDKCGEPRIERGFLYVCPKCHA